MYFPRGALSTFMSNDCVLTLIPGINLVNPSTPYVYDIRTQTYAQPAFAAQTLQRFLQVNERLLTVMRVTKPITLDENTKFSGTVTYAEFIKESLAVPKLASAALSALLEDLGQQTAYVSSPLHHIVLLNSLDSHPVLLAVDDIQALYCTSLYRDPEFKLIKSWHMSTPRMILEFLCGRKTFVSILHDPPGSVCQSCL